MGKKTRGRREERERDSRRSPGCFPRSLSFGHKKKGEGPRSLPYLPPFYDADDRTMPYVAVLAACNVYNLENGLTIALSMLKVHS